MRAVAGLLVLIAMACGSDGPRCGDIPGPPNAVTGIITSIERDGMGRITGFTVEGSNHDVDVHIARQRDYGFDLEHLEEHRARRLPVRVTLEERCGALCAVEILDA